VVNHFFIRDQKMIGRLPKQILMDFGQANLEVIADVCTVILKHADTLARRDLALTCRGNLYAVPKLLPHKYKIARAEAASAKRLAIMYARSTPSELSLIRSSQYSADDHIIACAKANIPADPNNYVKPAARDLAYVTATKHKSMQFLYASGQCCLVTCILRGYLELLEYPIPRYITDYGALKILESRDVAEVVFNEYQHLVTADVFQRMLFLARGNADSVLGVVDLLPQHVVAIMLTLKLQYTVRHASPNVLAAIIDVSGGYIIDNQGYHMSSNDILKLYNAGANIDVFGVTCIFKNKLTPELVDACYAEQPNETRRLLLCTNGNSMLRQFLSRNPQAHPDILAHARSATSIFKAVSCGLRLGDDPYLSEAVTAAAITYSQLSIEKLPPSAALISGIIFALENCDLAPSNGTKIILGRSIFGFISNQPKLKMSSRFVVGVLKLAYDISDSDIRRLIRSRVTHKRFTNLVNGFAVKDHQWFYAT
jgi:hypothetical protein